MNSGVRQLETHVAKTSKALVDWVEKDPDTRGRVGVALQNGFCNAHEVLDLSALDLSSLPSAVLNFPHVNEIRVRADFIYGAARRRQPITEQAPPEGQPAPRRRSAEVSEKVRESLHEWEQAGNGDTEHNKHFFFGHFLAKSSHIDARRYGGESLPEVLADFPHLRTISVTAEVLRDLKLLTD